jgi:YwiC-like protein
MDFNQQAVPAPAASRPRPHLFLRRVAVPAEHGSWVFLFSPLLAGLFIGGAWNLDGLALTAAALAGFLARSPLTTLVKIYSKRRAKDELPAAIFWLVVYSLIGLAALGVLILRGFGSLGWLALTGLPVFAWHLMLVSRRQERRKPSVEIVASGVLALTAPAAYWIGLGNTDPIGWLLWALMWLQAAGSILYAYMRLEQRVLKSAPTPAESRRMARRPLMYTGLALAAAVVACLMGLLPPLAALAFAFQPAETLYGAARPAVGYKPTAIGVRQLVVSTLFTAVFIAGWLI